MNLTLRKILYAVLASGSIVSALFAAFGFLTSVLATVFEFSWITFWSTMVCGAAVIGVICGFRTILALPVTDPATRWKLSAGIVGGGVPVLVVALLSLFGERSDWDAVLVIGYFVILPLLVGVALLVEMWRPAGQDG